MNPKVDITEASYTKELSSGPLPNITFLPSDKVKSYKEIAYENITQQIRFSLAAFPKKSKFSNIKFITIDYGIEENEDNDSEAKKEDDSKNLLFILENIAHKKSYSLSLGFYCIYPTLGGVPIFQGKISLGKTVITPVEAFNLLIAHLIEDIAVSALPEITIEMVK